ncbi:MAG: division/cell wall cluster transcriptional repressor MraZ [Candidatus Methylomirabilales bacterium]
MLTGEFRHSLDAKGRVFLPARWREELGVSVWVTRGMEASLFLMSPPRFEQWSGNVLDLSLDKQLHRAYRRALFSAASEEPVDRQGRITIPERLRSLAGLRRGLVLAGSGDVAEIWDEEAWDSNMSAADHFGTIAEHL